MRTPSIRARFIKADGIVHRRVTPFRLKYFFRKDIEQLLSETGLEVKNVFGSYERVPFTRKSSMMIFVAGLQSPG